MLQIAYSTFKTKFGLCLVASTSQGICNILFADSKKELLADLSSRWANVEFIENKIPAHTAVEKYFKDFKQMPKLKLHMHGTDFQIKVWEALLTIQSGKVSTYGDIAEKMGNRKMSRAVGAAIGDNPIGYIVPCHRVLKSTGEISGYRWGVERKRAMLSFEGNTL